MTLHELPSSYRDRAIASSAYGPWPGFKFEYATALALRTAWCLGPDSYSRLYYGALSRDILLVVFSQQVRLCRAFPLLRQASAKWRDCTLAGDLVLLDAQGRALQTWRDDQVAGCSREGQPVWLEVKVTARPCSDCKLKFQPQEPEAGSLEACVSITLGQPEVSDQVRFLQANSISKDACSYTCILRVCSELALNIKALSKRRAAALNTI